MKRLINYSRILHILTICCFLLPFYYTGCNKNGKEIYEKAVKDSIAQSKQVKNQDSLIAKPDSIKKEITTIDTSTTSSRQSISNLTTTEQTESEKMLANTISNKHPFFRPLLNPSEETYTGVGAVINTVPLFQYFAIFLAFVLLLISLTVKFIEKQAYKTIVLLDSLTFILLAFSQTISFKCERLWGLYLSLTVLCILTILDIFIIIRKNKEN